MAALHFILDSWWNTLAVLLAVALFSPVKVNINTREDDE